MNVEKFKNQGHRCSLMVREPIHNWRADRVCKNLAKFKVEGRLMCTCHAQKTVFDWFLLCNPSV